jgi:hypothetical protein
MSRTTSFITAVGAALVLVLPATALAKHAPVVEQPQWQQALMARSGALNEQYAPGEHRGGAAASYRDAFERAALATQGSVSRVAPYPDAFERALVTSRPVVSAEPFWRQAVRARSEALNRKHGLGSEGGATPVGHVDRYEVDLPSGPVTATSGGSGTEIDWQQIGAGFGIGILLALGLVLTLKLTRARSLAHG